MYCEKNYKILLSDIECSAHAERRHILPKLINEFIVVSIIPQKNYFWGDIKNDLRVHIEE